MFQRGEKVAIGASGGKDSTVLASVLKTLNERYDYGLELLLLSIDEGIAGYRDDSLDTVKRNKVQYGLPLEILSYKDLYGWTMDDIVKSIGNKNNCTFCGVFRRQALDRGALAMRVEHIVTGHNADDLAETILMNVLRGDIARLERCTEITTSGPSDASTSAAGGCGSGGGDEEVDEVFGGSGIKRSKPFKYAYEKEIVMYAYFKKLDYFSTECTYSPNAYRGTARAYLRELELIRPGVVLDIIHSGEHLKVDGGVIRKAQKTCVRCGYMSSNDLCKACLLLEGLNRGQPSLGVRSGRQGREATSSALSNNTTRQEDAGIGNVIPRWTRPARPTSEVPSASNLIAIERFKEPAALRQDPVEHLTRALENTANIAA
ncbi:cytoplasmic trna 2-thiolation protein 1 [Ceraceosorus bombacis]|uniref:Cytoplasmic trna 2-thiolation protein 1 n=1 Tax=Ceraceosorus bombacis TaxID=401625 RepID=A0A0P1BKH7_9BASI|nr:cytoplasmic trna 2-thiolation protein 1 [Ceraceosorus bombacis]